MSPSNGEPDGGTAPRRSRAFRVLGRLDPIPAFIVFGCLVVIAAGLIAVGSAIAYELTASTSAVPVGFALGLSVALLLGRDFLRWRLSWAAVVAVASFSALFIVAYW